MTGYRKSDKFIVPEKSLNKPNNMGAERMEERNLLKENKQQQNMLRTQRRLGVLNELLHIHQKAKPRIFHKYPSERFGVTI